MGGSASLQEYLWLSVVGLGLVLLSSAAPGTMLAIHLVYLTLVHRDLGIALFGALRTDLRGVRQELAQRFTVRPWGAGWSGRIATGAALVLLALLAWATYRYWLYPIPTRWIASPSVWCQLGRDCQSAAQWIRDHLRYGWDRSLARMDQLQAWESPSGER